MRIFLLLVLAAGLSSVSYGQEKGDSKLILTNELGAEANYLAFGKALLASGYEIDKRDDTFHQISTHPNLVNVPRKGKRTMRVYIIVDAICEDNKIVITAQHKAPGQRKMQAQYDPKWYQSAGTFAEMRKLAESIGGEIRFE